MCCGNPPGGKDEARLQGTPEFYQVEGGIETMVLRVESRKAPSFGRLDEAMVRCE